MNPHIGTTVSFEPSAVVIVVEARKGNDGDRHVPTEIVTTADKVEINSTVLDVKDGNYYRVRLAVVKKLGDCKAQNGDVFFAGECFWRLRDGWAYPLGNDTHPFGVFDKTRGVVADPNTRVQLVVRGGISKFYSDPPIHQLPRTHVVFSDAAIAMTPIENMMLE